MTTKGNPAMTDAELQRLRELADGETERHASDQPRSEAEMKRHYEWMRAMRSAVPALLDEVAKLRKEVEELSRYHLDEFTRYKQARNDQHERYDVLYAQFTAAQATLTAECVDHAELNGHIDIAEQCRDYLALSEEDTSGKLEDFVASLGVVIQQLDRQRRRANWYEAAHEAGKEKLIESRLARALEAARGAAHELAKATTALGLAAPDTPEVLATANPIADAEFKLWSALGIDCEHPAVTERAAAGLADRGAAK